MTLSPAKSVLYFTSLLLALNPSFRAYLSMKPFSVCNTINAPALCIFDDPSTLSLQMWGFSGMLWEPVAFVTSWAASVNSATKSTSA